ncbi:MAG: MipA/OmpV family protein [Puniceicoccaceae bacterium]
MTFRFIERYLKKNFPSFVIGFTCAAMATGASPSTNPTPEDWGMGMVYRVASIPYIGSEDYIGSFVPVLFFEDDLFFLRGTSGGITPLRWESWELSLLGRFRFMDLPDDLVEKKFADDLFMGAQLRYKLGDWQRIDLEALADSHGRMVTNLRWSGRITSTEWQLQPYLQAQFKSKKMNSFYYGLDQQALEQGYEFSAGLQARYHLFRNLYMLGSAGVTYLDEETTRSVFVEDSWATEVSIGFSIGHDPGYVSLPREEDGPRPYIRVAHGLGNLSNFLEILSADIKRDPYNNQLTSVFYGFPLADSLFGLPVDTYLTAGAAWHWESEVQDSGQELILAFKFYYTVPLPWRVRIGFAEGISYITEPTYIEYVNIEEDQLEPVNWQNYLDFSVDVNLGDVFTDSLDRFWLGFGVHHRSAIFGNSQQFGRSNAGSNYNTLYLQIDL